MKDGRGFASRNPVSRSALNAAQAGAANSAEFSRLLMQFANSSTGNEPGSIRRCIDLPVDGVRHLPGRGHHQPDRLTPAMTIRPAAGRCAMFILTATRRACAWHPHDHVGHDAEAPVAGCQQPPGDQSRISAESSTTSENAAGAGRDNDSCLLAHDCVSGP